MLKKKSVDPENIIPYPPCHRRDLKFLGGGSGFGVLKTKILLRLKCMEFNSKFKGGGGGRFKNSIPWERYG